MIFIRKPDASQSVSRRMFLIRAKKAKKNEPAAEKFNFISKSGKTFASRIKTIHKKETD